MILILKMYFTIRISKPFIVALGNFIMFNFFLLYLITIELQYISLFKKRIYNYFNIFYLFFLLKVPEYLFIKSTGSHIVTCIYMYVPRPHSNFIVLIERTNIRYFAFYLFHIYLVIHSFTRPLAFVLWPLSVKLVNLFWTQTDFFCYMYNYGNNFII